MPHELANAAAWNMAFDEALLERVLDCYPGIIVRLYRWTGPAVTIGRFQTADGSLDRVQCDVEHIPVARRITGGRGILHGADITVSITARLDSLGMESGASVTALYRTLSQLFVDAYELAGLRAVTGTENRRRASQRVGDCFRITTEADVVSLETGSKMLGCALHLRPGGVLLQASMRTSESESQRDLAERLFRYSGLPETNAEPSPEQLVAATTAATRRYFGVDPEEPVDLEGVRNRATELYTTRYIDAAWMMLR
jgi:lipoate-protein ligase A